MILGASIGWIFEEYSLASSCKNFISFLSNFPRKRLEFMRKVLRLLELDLELKNIKAWTFGSGLSFLRQEEERVRGSWF